MAANAEPGEDAIDLLLDNLSAALSGDTELESRVSTIERRLADDVSRKEKPGRREPRSRRRKRMVSVRFAVLLAVLAVAGTAFALTQTTLTTEFLEIFKSQTGPTEFSVTQFSSSPSGDNEVSIFVEISNDDTVNAHFANVTVNILNATGDEIANLTQASGLVSASGTWSATYVFIQTNIVAEYETAQIIVKQSS